MTHWMADDETPSSFWMFGTAMETIVWSMNIIATANTIAASATYFFEPVACVVVMIRS